jgi:hypothetical protein
MPTDDAGRNVSTIQNYIATSACPAPATGSDVNITTLT